MNKTFIPASNYNKRKWYVIDCKDKQLGRLASTIVPLLTGKSKSIYRKQSGESEGGVVSRCH